MRVVKRQSGSKISDSSLSTHTSWPEIIKKNTDDTFDFVSELFDEFEGEHSNCDYPFGFDDDAFVYLGKGTFAQKIALSILVFSVFE